MENVILIEAPVVMGLLLATCIGHLLVERKYKD